MKVFWNKFKTWQKKLVLVMSITIAVTYLYPRAVFVFKFASGIIEFQLKIPEFKRKMQMLVNYISVDKGLAKSQMVLVDSLPRYVEIEINDKLVERKADIYRGHSGDCKVFVDDGDVGMYGAYYNYTQGNWEYYDFYKQYHLTYIKK